MRKVLLPVVLTVMCLTLDSSVAALETTVIESSVVQAEKSDLPFLLKVEVVDKTAGQSLSKEQIDNITNEIVNSIKNKYPTVTISSNEPEKANAVLRIVVVVFTSGNRALRFWVGFGAGKAHMKITAEWLEGNPVQLKESKEYQRFGAGSLRGGETIEMQMRELIGQYSVEFIANHIKKGND